MWWWWCVCVCVGGGGCCVGCVCVCVLVWAVSCAALLPCVPAWGFPFTLPGSAASLDMMRRRASHTAPALTTLRCADRPDLVRAPAYGVSLGSLLASLLRPQNASSRCLCRGRDQLASPLCPSAVASAVLSSLLAGGRLRAGLDSERLRREGLSGSCGCICDDCEVGLREAAWWPVRWDLRGVDSAGAVPKCTGP